MGPGSNEFAAEAARVQGESVSRAMLLIEDRNRARSETLHGLVVICPQISVASLSLMFEPAEFLLFGEIKQSQNSDIYREEVNVCKTPDGARTEVSEQLGHGMGH